MIFEDVEIKFMRHFRYRKYDILAQVKSVGEG